MSEMVERAARAIAKRRGCPTNYPPPCHVCEKADGCMGSARAAIASLRVPTPEMLAAAMAETATDLESEWRAMIDAALLDAPTIAERG